MSNLIERVARAIMEADGLVMFDTPDRVLKVYAPLSKAAIAVVLKDMEAESYECELGIMPDVFIHEYARENGVPLDE